RLQSLETLISHSMRRMGMLMSARPPSVVSRILCSRVAPVDHASWRLRYLTALHHLVLSGRQILDRLLRLRCLRFGLSLPHPRLRVGFMPRFFMSLTFGTSTV